LPVARLLKVSNALVSTLELCGEHRRENRD
jgi:hypothetical protein